MGTSQLGAMLVSEGLLTESDRRTVRQISGQGGAAFARGVLAMGLLDENELASFLAEKTRWKIAKKDLFSASNQDVWTIFDSALLQLLEVFPLKRDRTTIHVAMVDPLDLETINQLEFFSELKVHPVISTQSQIRSCLKKMMQSYHPSHSTLENFIENHAAAASRRIAMRENIFVPTKRQGGVSPAKPEPHAPAAPSTPADISQAFTATRPIAAPPTTVASKKALEPARDELEEGLDVDDDLGDLELEENNVSDSPPSAGDDSEPFEEPVEESLAVGPAPNGAGIPKIDVNSLGESDDLGDFDLDGEFETEEGETPVEGLLDSLDNEKIETKEGNKGINDQDFDLDSIAEANEAASLATKDDLDDITAIASPETLEESSRAEDEGLLNFEESALSDPDLDLTDPDFKDEDITEPGLGIEDTGIIEPDLNVEDTGIIEPDLNVEDTGIIEQDLNVEDTGIIEQDLSVEDTGIIEPDLGADNAGTIESNLSVEDTDLTLENHEASQVSPEQLDEAIGELDRLHPPLNLPADDFPDNMPAEPLIEPETDSLEPEAATPEPKIDRVDPLIDLATDPLSLDEDPLLALDLAVDLSLPQGQDGSQDLMLSLNEALIFVSLAKSRIQVSKKLHPKFLDWGLTAGQLGMLVEDKATTLLSWKPSPTGQDLTFETSLDGSHPKSGLPSVLKKALVACPPGLCSWSPKTDELLTLQKAGVIADPTNQTCWLGVQDEGKSKKIYFWFFANKSHLADSALHEPVLDLFIRLSRLPQ